MPRICFNPHPDSDIDELKGFVDGMIIGTRTRILNQFTIAITTETKDLEENLRTIATEPYFEDLEFTVDYR